MANHPMTALGGAEVDASAPQFIRRVYFDRNTLETIFFFSTSGQFRKTSVQEDWETNADLQANIDRRDDIDILEWNEPDADVEALCEEAAWLGVRRSDTDPSGYELYDAADEQPEYIDPDSEASRILAFLRGEAELPDTMPSAQRAEILALRAAMGTSNASAQRSST